MKQINEKQKCCEMSKIVCEMTKRHGEHEYMKQLHEKYFYNMYASKYGWKNVSINEKTKEQVYTMAQTEAFLRG